MIANLVRVHRAHKKRLKNPHLLRKKIQKFKYLFRIGGVKAIKPVSIANPDDLEVPLPP